MLMHGCHAEECVLKSRPTLSTDLDCSGFSAVIAIIIILRGHDGCQLRGGALSRVGLFDDCQAVQLGNVTQQFHVKNAK